MNPVLREITASLLFVVMGVQSVAAQAPTWWAEQNVLMPQAVPDDFAAINQGQLKALASAAFRAMEDRLQGGAGSTVSSLVTSWQQPTLNTDDFAVVTSGQLKKVAQPFYDRMNQVLGSTGYPWSASTSPDDFGIVNLGQAKRMFAFDIPRSTPVTTTPPLPVVTDPFANNNPAANLNLAISQANWGASTAHSFNVADISGGEEGGDPSTDVIWQVAKAELSVNEKNTPPHPPLKWRFGQSIKCNTHPLSWDVCEPQTDSDPADVGEICNCQHGTPFFIGRLFGEENGYPLLGWDHLVGGSYFCDATNNYKIGTASIRFRINNDWDGADPLVLPVVVTTYDPIFGLTPPYSRDVILFNRGTNDRESDPLNITAPIGGWVKIDTIGAAEDASPAPLSVSDAAGPRYRKVGLNGIPMPDSKPQVQNENGEENEETYIDAFSAQIRHSVSDVYVSDAATLLPLTVRRDVTSDAWNNRYGLRPGERTGQPFGPGWSSNVCGYVRFTYTDENITAEVVDEMGGTQRFVRLNGQWHHDGQEARDMKSYQNELVTSTPTLAEFTIHGSPANVEVYGNIQLKKKFGTVCDYKMVSPTHLSQVISGDRIDHEGSYTVHVYARLDLVTDRMGNELKYEYPFDNTLIPGRIHDPARPGHQILIQQSGGLVSAVRGPGGDLIKYEYGLQQQPVPNVPAGKTASPLPCWALESVTKNFNEDETVGSDVVRYGYTLDQVFIEDDRDDPTKPGDPKPVTYASLELGSITDERGGVYRFTHQRNDSVLRYTGNVYKIARGQPMTLTSVTLPNNQVTHLQVTDLGIPPHVAPAPFTSSNPRLQFPFASDYSPPGVRVVITPPFTGAAATAPKYTYEFSLPEWIPLIGLTTNPSAVAMGYKIMKITAPDGGVESYFYDHAENTVTRTPGFSMLLTCVQDRNGQQTRFVYGDNPPDMPVSFDDPTQEITSFTSGTTTRDIVKTMTYDPVSRILKKTSVKRGNVAPITEITSTYGIDALFRRTSETSEGKSGTTALPGGSKKTLVYGHTAFPGFVTAETLDSAVARTVTGTATLPGTTEVPVVTKTRATEASDPGTPAWWRTISETVTLGGQPATTKTWSDFNGNKRLVRDGRGHITQFEYDGRQRLIKVTHPDGSFKTLAYDAHGNLIQETDELGTATFHEYDILNRRIKTTFDLDRNGNPGPRYTSVEVNGTTTTYNGDLVTDTTYNHFNLPVTVTDPRGIVTLHEYDILGRLVKKTVNSTGTLQQVVSYDYKLVGVNGGKEAGGTLFDTSGFKPVRVTDPRGSVTQFEYDSLYRQIREVRPDGGIIHKTYDDTGLLLSVSEPTAPGKAAANVTSTVYNAQGQPQRVTYADALFTETYYTPSGQPWKTKDETGLEARTHYNSAGMPIKSIVMSGTSVALHPTTMTSYDLAGNPASVTDPLGNVTQQFHDARNRPVQVLAPQVLNAAVTPPVMVTPTTLTTYDPLGRVTAVTDPLGNVTQKIYDAAGRVTAVTDALNQTSQMSYNQVGAVLTTTNALNQTTTNVYDALGRLITTTDAAGIANHFGYDLAGNRTLVKDGKNQETTFVYDAFGRLTQQTFANGDAWSYSYFTAWVSTTVPANYLDKNSQTDPAGRVTTFTYDKRHRLKTMVRTKVTGGSESYDLDATYTYGTGASAGRLLKVVNKTLGASVGTTGPVATTVTVSYTYDKLGRVLTEVNNGQTHSYVYDKAGNRTRATLDCGNVSRVIQTWYDALNRPVSILDNNATASITTDDGLTSYRYDLAGRALTLEQPNGQKATNSYDALGRLTGRTLKSGMGATLATFTWQHDAIGAVLQQSEDWAAAAGAAARTRTTVNTYDSASRLATETIAESGSATVTTTYSYDAAHNRSTKTVAGGPEAGDWSYTYNAANQLTVMDKAAAGASPAVAVNYSYDANGNRTQSSRVTGTAAAQFTAYQWNAWDKLIGVNLPDGKKYSYTYDYRTRRIATAQATAGGLTARHTAITFSGGLSVAEFERTTVTGTISIPKVQYIRGPDMGGGVGGLLRTVRNPVSSTTGLPIATTATNPATQRHNLSNGRGDIVAQSDSGGALTWTASYEAYGKRTKETGTNADKQRANTKDEDPTGLLNEGFRYRDIETGVWLSRDPAGFVDGPNLYAYVMQNPWSAFDPEGLDLQHLVSAWMSGDFSPQTFVGELSLANDAVRQVQQGLADGNKIAQTYNSFRENGASKAQAGTAASVMTLGLLTGALPVAESIEGERIVATDSGVDTQEMSGGDRVMQGLLGTAQMGLCFYGASFLRRGPVKGAKPGPPQEMVPLPVQQQQAQARGSIGQYPKSPRGKGSVPPGQRDPRRLFSEKQQAAKFAEQDGKCKACDNETLFEQMDGHHTERHADGGQTVPEKLHMLCEECHREVHRK